jgi:CDP-glycerol glycerophosphotransferase (TagB/SpsB family)
MYSNRCYVLQIQQNYTFEILRPLQTAILAQGGKVLWFVVGNDVDETRFTPFEEHTHNVDLVKAFSPDAVFVTGNVVPDFIPGLKVQVFHGFEWKKKGHFRIRGSFDLYCTQGPFFTRKFAELAQENGDYFDVEQTGWPKMDNIFPLYPDINTIPRNKITGDDEKGFATAINKSSVDNDIAVATMDKDKSPCILYAPTFSPSFSSAIVLQETIFSLAAKHPWKWHIKFHPKQDPVVIQTYQELAEKHENVVMHGNVDLMNLIRESDLVLSDTSSAIAETILLGKPVVTFKNSVPDKYLFDITEPEHLEHTLEKVIQGSAEQSELINEFTQEYHPYTDGKSSERILAVVEEKLQQGLQASNKKPSNHIRNLKLRKTLRYWKFW